eukprot:jgi/Astpho2/7214/Aster-x0764
MSATARPLLLLSHEIHMDVLASYASSEDDSDGPGQPKDAFRGQCQSGKIQLIGRKRKALPGAADLLAGASGGDAIGLEYRAGRPDPEAAQCSEQHQGRSRRFKHVEGNYATSVFIPVSLLPEADAAIDILLGRLQSQLPGLHPVMAAAEEQPGRHTAKTEASPRGLHVSLSRVVPIRYSQIDPLHDLLRQVLRDHDRRSPNGAMPFPWETVPPMAIICVATAAMGALPGFIHKGLYGKPKATGVDEWDRRERDARLVSEHEEQQQPAS